MLSMQTTDSRRFKMAIAQSQLTTQARRQHVSSSLSLSDTPRCSLSILIRLHSTPYIGSDKSGSVSGILVPSTTFQRVQSHILRTTPSHKLLYLLSARWRVTWTLPALRHTINIQVTAITSRHLSALRRMTQIQLWYFQYLRDSSICMYRKTLGP